MNTHWILPDLYLMQGWKGPDYKYFFYYKTDKYNYKHDLSHLWYSYLLVISDNLFVHFLGPLDINAIASIVSNTIRNISINMKFILIM